MPESGLSGSVRGVPSNGHPYRDPGQLADIIEPYRHFRFVPEPDVSRCSNKRA